MGYKVRDHYSNKAKKDNFTARSAYKLMEIHKRTKLIRPGDQVLDLGCSPGSWVQVVSPIVGKDGFILGVDLKPAEVKFDNFEFVLGDINQIDLTLFAKYTFDNVLSDMAPNTTGNKSVDQARSMQLVEMALHIAKERLKKGGNFVAKIFMNHEFKEFTNQLRAEFHEVKTIRPDSVRKSSTEVFVVGLGKKTDPILESSD